MINNANPYANFSKLNNSSNKAYLSYTYANKNEIKYYNDNPIVDEKKERKKKVSKALIIGSSIFGLIGICLLAIGKGNNGTKVSDIVANAQKALKKGAQDIDEKSGKKISKIFEKISNLGTNITNVKDDGWDRFLHWKPINAITKPIRKFNDWIQPKIDKITLNSNRKEFQSKLDEIKKLAQESGVEVGNFEDKYDDIFENSYGIIKKSVKEKRVSIGLFNGEKSKLKNFIDNVTSPLGNKTFAQEINEKVYLKAPKKSSSELIQAIEEFNSAYENKIIGKQRDFAIGSVPTDFLTSGLPIVGLGVGLATCDDKEKRKSVAIELGIPIVSTLSMPFIGYFKSELCGFKGMAIGFAVGEVFKLIAEKVNYFAFKNKNSTEITEISEPTRANNKEL